ncbi:MOSC domain-containing protein [Rothia sp. ZJ932]|uniref:MOSC domain-containing protein n=1 Tax=Rothia sp. ZJ932 TaxID=2810516 RepID=UPI00196885FC|nr:MOSC domain-containing protein [Rothia sp. ZJ932]QRZ61824.1 MOSC domain-containing protein [Rothia sp. ZJ932]
MTETLHVVSAGFSHLKGTSHQPRHLVELTDKGVIGDRELCLVDPVQKRVLRTVQNPALLKVITEVADNRLTVSFPDGKSYTTPLVETGEVIVCDYWGRNESVHPIAGQLSEVFTYYLGRPVLLARAERNIVYGRPLTIIGTASLKELGQRLGAENFEQQYARFRASLVVETSEPFIEETWQGCSFDLTAKRGILAQDNYSVNIANPVPRCAVIDYNPATGEKDARILKTLASFRLLNDKGEPCFGVFASLR